MSEVIKQHYKDEDIQYLNLCTDVNKWKSEIAYIELENQFYTKLLSSPLIGKADVNKQDLKFLLEELKVLNIKNQHFSDKIRDFINELDGITECDDLHCETYYLNYFQKFKVEIENYFFENRNLKTVLYSSITHGIKKFL